MPVIRQFELYNQPLVDDPNSADMLSPMMTGVTDGKDIAEEVKAYIVSQLGRRDIHKFQNVIENGDTPTIGFPDAGLNLMVKLDSGYSRVGHLRAIDWVNIWMTENLGYNAYQIVAPTDDSATLIGIIETSSSLIPLISYDVGGEEPYTVIEKSSVEVPKPIPEGIYRLEYTFTEVEESSDDGEVEEGENSAPTITVEFNYYVDSSVDFSFDEENGDLRVFPPLPIRLNNTNYYAFDDTQKINDINLLSRVIGLKADTIINLIMDSDDVVGNEDLVDNVFINFGTRIHDNSSASCRYIFKFLNYLVGYGDEYGSGLSEFTDCGVKPIIDTDGQEVDPSTLVGEDEVFHGISHCNVFTVKTDNYYSEFTFSHVEIEVKSIAEILADPVMGEQYIDREKSSGALWYISSSAGDLSDEDGYEQPEGDNEDVPFISFGECNGETVTLITVFSPGGTVVITDNGSGMSVTRVLNPSNVNSVLIPYIPSIGEQLTNNELADNFLTSLHASIYVANYEVVKLPWWVALLKVVMFIVTIVLIIYAAYALTFWKFAILMVAGYLAGLAVNAIVKNFGVIAGVIATIVVVALSKGAANKGALTGLYATFANMTLKEILLTVLDVIIKSVEIIQRTEYSELIDDTSELTDQTNYYRDEITKMNQEQAKLDELGGGFVEIEPLLQPLLNTSIRTEVNPMDPGAYFDMYNDFHNIGFELQDYDRMFEDPFNMDAMLQPV